MAKKIHELTANVSTENPRATRRVLEDLIEKGSVSPVEDGFQVKAAWISTMCPNECVEVSNRWRLRKGHAP
jgi:hypothetical protein